MELLFETRREVRRVEGKLYAFQVRPELHPRPVLGPDSFVDGAGASIYGTVLHDGGRYRMWYQAWPRDWAGHDVDLVGYAESEDGLEWHKPPLGLVAYGPGANNLCDLGFHSPSVFIDPEAPPGERYRAAGFTGPGRMGARAQVAMPGYYTAHSADGLHWELDRLTPQWASADVITSAYHPGQRRAIAALKYTRPANGILRRCIWNAEFTGGAWSEAVTALVPDEFDDVLAISRGYASADYYGLGMMPAGSGTVGFLWSFRHSLPRTPGTGAGVFGSVDVSLVYQAGRGHRWLHRPGRAEFLHHEALPWTVGGIYTASAATDAGDEQWLYFTGTLHTHGWYINEQWQLLEARRRELIEEGQSRIGVARWPKDRLFGFRADPVGVLDLELWPTQPCELYLNLKTRHNGTVRVELPNLPGRSLAEAVPLAGDHLAQRVRWLGGGELVPTDNGPVLARIHLDSAEVYAYELRPLS